MIPGGIASHPIPGRGSSNPERGTGGSWDDSRWCSVEETVLFIPGRRFCLYQGVLNHTSDLAAASALMACRLLPSGCDGVTWLASGLGWRPVLLLGSLSNIQDCGWPALTTKGSRLGQRGGVDRQLRIWACGTGQQRIHDPWPFSISFPSLSIWTSQFGPRRQSREGFGGGLLKSR